MLITLADARKACKRFVDDGTCQTERIDTVVNDAVERLAQKAEKMGFASILFRTIRFGTCNQMIALPYNVEKVVAVDTNGEPVRIFSPYYQFLSSGPGDLTQYSGGVSSHLVDQGDGWPTMFDIPLGFKVGTVWTPVDLGMRVAAFSTDAQDVGVSLMVYGTTKLQMEVRTGDNPGEAVPINQWSGGVEGQVQGPWGESAAKMSSALFCSVSRVVKPVTHGYITLYAVDPGSNRVFFLGKYHPEEKIPSFRRYKVTSRIADEMISVLCLVKMRSIPATRETDILLVDNLAAIKLMVMAIREEDKGNVTAKQGFESEAERVLRAQAEGREVASGMPQVIDVEYRLSGAAKNRGYSII